MRIGILSYSLAYNFGANLQALSTYSYLVKQGHSAFIINWMPKDLEETYNHRILDNQKKMYQCFRKKIWAETPPCNSAAEIANVIEEFKIEAVIIGSDAVVQHHPFLENIVFPTKRLISIIKRTSDTVFPNPFWGTFNDYLDKPIPIGLMSASSQDSKYQYYNSKLKHAMYERASKYNFLTVRDIWTQKMFIKLSSGKIIPEVTPDPVFAFNQNVDESLIPSESEIKEKFNIDNKYFILSFKDNKTVSQNWINEFERIAASKGFTCIIIPFSNKLSFGSNNHTLGFPLSPLEWYSLIKYSSGYIGHNMHPIIVSLINLVPFFSFDTYGTVRFNGLLFNDYSSKILHILKKAQLEGFRVSCLMRHFIPPTPDFVLDKVMNFEKCKSEKFRRFYLDEYNRMMINLINTIKL